MDNLEMPVYQQHMPFGEEPGVSKAQGIEPTTLEV